MKQSWLFLSITCFLMIVCSSVSVSVFLFAVALIFHVRHFTKGHILFLLLLAVGMFQSLPFEESNAPQSHIIEILEIKSSYAVGYCENQKVLIYGLSEVSFHDVIEVKGTFKKIDGVHNPPLFYFPEWCERRKITYAIQAEAFTMVKAGTGASHDLYVHIQQMDNEKKTMINEMLYGIHEEDADYLITSSGMHIVTVWQIIRSVLSIFFGSSTLEMICFFGMGMHAYLTVFSSTMQRILGFQLIHMLCPGMDDKDSLGCSMYLVLMLAPYMAFELSFLIPVAFRLVSIFNVSHVKKRLTSFFVLIPIQWYCLGEVNVISMVLFPLYRKLYALLYAGVCLLVFLPLPLSLLQEYRSCLQILSSYELTYSYAASIGWVVIWSVQVIRYLTWKRTQTLFAFGMLLLYTQYGTYLDPFGEVYMIDVGQGDCTIIRLPFHQGVVMIDAMGSPYKNIPEDIILPVLKSRQINRIDVLIVTHDDYDHSGGVETLKELISIDRIITTKQGDITVNGTPFHFLCTDYEGEDANENSIITYFEMYDTGFLFMGDAGIPAEQHLMNTYRELKVDVLKAGHHGSRSSSSPAFLHHYEPSLALISAGRNNRYGHPHQEVMETLEKEGIYPLVTSKHGGVSIRFCKFLRFFKTADNEFGIID